MKKISILALAAVGLFTAACSSSESVNDVQVPTTLDGKGQGFLSVNVNLPFQPVSSTRGWEEQSQLDDGVAREYAVDDVLLVLFGGNQDPNQATVLQAWSPTTIGFKKVSDDPNQVTTRDKYVVKLREGITGPYYVLAVLNAHDLVKIKADGTGITDAGGTDVTKLSQLQGMIISANATTGETPFVNNKGANKQDGFFMTNAVLSDKQSGTISGVSPIVLAPVSLIYESEEAANAANAVPSVDVYVERGLAKVTLSATLAFDESVKTKSGDALLVASLGGWVLDNTNLSSYLVRQTPTNFAAEWGYYNRQASKTSNDYFRFVGVNNVDKPKALSGNDNPEEYSPVVDVVTESAYRTYWSPDPNYADNSIVGKLYEPKVKTYPTDINAPQYCFENTFDVDHQNYKNTTRVVAKVILNSGKNFYTIRDDRKTLYQLADVKKAIYARMMLNEDFRTWASTNISGTVSESSFADVLFKESVAEGTTVAGTIHVTDVKVNATAGVVNFSEQTVGAKSGATILADVMGYVGRIQQYPQGETYYAVRIKHFGDDLTPWGWNGETEPTVADDTDAKKIAKIYPQSGDVTPAENYLGRYGVLRNNWYVISLDKILKIGHPIVPWLNPGNDPNPDPDDPDNPNPEDPDHPDDSLDDSYISARINILSWAKRPQGVILK